MSVLLKPLSYIDKSDKGRGGGWDITIIEDYPTDVLGKLVLYPNESYCTTIK